MNFVPSFAVISPTGFFRTFMPGRVTAHGMRSSVTVFASPCVMIRCGGGSAFGNGNFEGGVGGCCACTASDASSAAAATKASIERASSNDRDCCKSNTSDTNFGSERGTSQAIILSAAFDFRFLYKLEAPLQELQIGGTNAPGCRSRHGSLHLVGKFGDDQVR